jgi:hypothetical protein
METSLRRDVITYLPDCTESHPQNSILYTHRSEYLKYYSICYCECLTLVREVIKKIMHLVGQFLI